MNDLLLMCVLASVVLAISTGFGRYAREHAVNPFEGPTLWLQFLVFEEVFYQGAFITACVLLSVSGPWWFGLVLYCVGFVFGALLLALIKGFIYDFSKAWTIIKVTLGLASEILLAYAILSKLPEYFTVANYEISPFLPIIIFGLISSRNTVSSILARFGI